MSHLANRLTPLDEAWWQGAWVRDHSGPTLRGDTVRVGRWHRVEGVERSHGLHFACRRGMGQTWPSGGGRMEVAHDSLRLPPGDVCSRCIGRTWDDVAVPFSEDAVEQIAIRVAALLSERPEHRFTTEFTASDKVVTDRELARELAGGDTDPGTGGRT